MELLGEQLPAPSSGVYGGRRLLSDCNVVGSVGKGGSIALLLFIGFMVGASFSWIIFWRRERRQRRIELEYRNRFGDSIKRDLPDVTALVKAAHMPTISKGCELAAGESQLRVAACTLAAEDGPLAMGVATATSAKMGSGPAGAGPGSSDALQAALSLKELSNTLAAAAPGVLRSSAGNPFAGEVPRYNVRKNEVCSLNNSPAHTPSPTNRQQGLIGTGVFAPAADPSSPRITTKAATVAAAGAGPLCSHPPAAATTPTTGFAWPGLRDCSPGPLAAARGSGSTSAAAASPVAASDEEGLAADLRTDSVVVKPAPCPTLAAAANGTGSDYLAALHSTATNPFEAPAPLQQQHAWQQEQAQALLGKDRVQEQEQDSAAQAASKAAHKQELLQQVQGEEYGDDDLDPEWASLLADLDERLQTAGRPRLSDKERAVAIRSLIVATASQSADAALRKAMHDVETFRRAQSFKTGA